MMYKAKAAVCSYIHTKHSTQSERNVEFFNVKPCGFIKKALGFKRLILFFNPYEILFAKFLVKITFEISKHSWKDNIQMCLHYMDSEDMSWTQVFQDKILWTFR